MVTYKVCTNIKLTCTQNILTIEEGIEFPTVQSAKQMPEKSLEAKRIGRLGSLPQFRLGLNLDNDCSIVFYNPCTTILLTCTS
jgi:hypothetical protein